MSAGPVAGTRSAHGTAAAGCVPSSRRLTRESSTWAMSRTPDMLRATTASRSTCPPSSPQVSASRSERHSQVTAVSPSASSAWSPGSASRSTSSKRAFCSRRTRSSQIPPSTPRWSARASARSSVSVADISLPSLARTCARTVTWSTSGLLAARRSRAGLREPGSLGAEPGGAVQFRRWQCPLAQARPFDQERQPSIS